MDLNDRFTDLADFVSECVSHWLFTAISLVVLAIWITYGIYEIPGWFTSATWNFPLNTITTVGEWFLEGFVLLSTMRLERRSRELQLNMLDLLKKIAAEEEQELDILERK